MPITPAQINIVKSTVPILKTGGEALTTHFYKLMFREYPEVKALFNQTHQSSGTQPRALANSVLAYAENIDALQNLGPVAAQIVNKHVALQVMPEHYPIVGTCLLRAIREVLGEETATQEVLDAWGAAYGQLADILIGAEAKVYKDTAETPGGWAGARSFIVKKKVKESDVITSFYLEPADGKEVISYQPGQYIGLQLFAGTPNEARRNYSLSQAADGKSLRISVKKEEGGVVSTHLHEQVNAGDSLNVFPPSGHFVLKKSVERPVALVSGGVGITPTLAMLQTLAAFQKQNDASSPTPTVRFVHFARSPAVHAFAEDVQQITQENNMAHHFIYDNPPAAAEKGKELEDTSSFGKIDEWLGKDTDVDVYLLGPTPFMRKMRKALIAKGVPADQIALEFFGPAEALE